MVVDLKGFSTSKEGNLKLQKVSSKLVHSINPITLLGITVDDKGDILIVMFS